MVYREGLVERLCKILVIEVCIGIFRNTRGVFDVVLFRLEKVFWRR